MVCLDPETKDFSEVFAYLKSQGFSFFIVAKLDNSYNRIPPTQCGSKNIIPFPFDPGAQGGTVKGILNAKKLSHSVSAYILKNNAEGGCISAFRIESVN